MRSLLALALLLVLQVCLCDIYLHNPRGSNNRLDEANRNRNNARRIFNSQNNDRGGYNVGGMFYYVGSTLSVEWTNQHSCSDPNNNCDLILQYMCEDDVRDGATTSTIPSTLLQCQDQSCNRDLRFGMHENFDYYILCRLRERNQGLFTADQNVGNTATRTRQNRNGQRYGYECQEERDYYPYWAPSPWIDIAVMTSRTERCDYYRANSYNVLPRYFCNVGSDYIRSNLGNTGRIPITEEECLALDINATWAMAPALSSDPPDCILAPRSRDNHLGNGVLYPGFPNYYNWTIPNHVHEHCVLRMRYNISTADYQDWDGVNADNNTRRNELALDVWSRFGLTSEQAEERGYLFENNPEVEIFDEFQGGTGGNDFNLRLAINTAQFGRTFQDRSHVFSIRPLPSTPECNGRIANLNVRGKRGNIVQVYPAVEYDFVPNRLTIPVGSCIHIQWTGSNTNPNNNDGQGLRGTDRSNIVLLEEGFPGLERSTAPLGYGENFGVWSTSYPRSIMNARFLNMSMQMADYLATLSNIQLRGEMSELDDAGTYYNLGLYKATLPGTYYYMCTRNNNFTNRSQKGVIYVTNQVINTGVVGPDGGSLQVTDAGLIVGDNVFADSSQVSLTIWPTDLANAMFGTPNAPVISSFVQLQGVAAASTADSDNVTLTLTLDRASTSDSAGVYIANADTGFSFRRIDASIEGNTAMVQSTTDGVYAVYLLQAPIIAGAIVGVILLILLIIASLIVIYFLVFPSRFKNLVQKTKGGFNNVGRSFTKKV